MDAEKIEVESVESVDLVDLVDLELSWIGNPVPVSTQNSATLSRVPKNPHNFFQVF